MSRARAITLPALVTAGLIGISAATVSMASVESPTPTLSRLGGQVISLLPSATAAGLVSDLGPLDPTTSIQTMLTLSRPDPAGELALQKSEEDPSSPDYLRFLTPAQFAARFAVPASSYQAVIDFATAKGMTVVSRQATRDSLLLSGTAAQVEATYGVNLERYAYKGTDFWATAQDPLVPAGVAGVIGLDSLHKQTTNAEAAAARGKTPAQSPCVSGVCAGPLDVTDFYSAYDMPADQVGTGQRIAVFGEGQTSTVVSDLPTFEDMYKLPHVPVNVVSVGDDFKDTAGTGEWDLDTQSSSGIASGVSGETLYFGKALDDATVNALYSTWANDANGPAIANASFGECEPFTAPGGLTVAQTPVVTVPVPVDPTGGTLDELLVIQAGIQQPASYAAEHAALQQARVEGRTLFSSTGDQGGSCYYALPNAFENNGVPLLNTPAADPDAVGVGGTDLQTSGGTTPARVLERTASESGGGESPEIPADAYQSSIERVGAGLPALPCLADQQGNPAAGGSVCRSLPDVVADSGDITLQADLSGFNIISDGSEETVAGTSLSSPLTAGVWARILGAEADRAPAGLGFADVQLYRLGGNPTTDARDFFDVTLGTNGQRTATAGYDQASGLGVIDVANAITDLRPATPLSPVVPVVPVATPAPSVSAAPKSTACTALRGSALKIYGARVARPNRHGQVLYTFKLFINQGSCKTPNPVGRQFFVYVDGHKSAVLRTGKSGVQSYLVRLTPGMHTITAAFPGNRDLKKSASAKFRSREA